MPWLIDAANLGGVLGGAAGARNSQAILAALLPWARERKQVVVVFDGRSSVGLVRLRVRRAGEELGKVLKSVDEVAGKEEEGVIEELTEDDIESLFK